MKYFTPDLYLQFGAKARRDVLKAHDAWEDATESYKQHLERIGPKLTANARRVAETLCLHDADYLGMAVLPTPDTHKSLAVLLTRQDPAQMFLVYYLAEEPLIQAAEREWPYSKQQVHWLYDEFDVSDDGLQQHEILLSNGHVTKLRFYEMQVLDHKIHEPALV